MASVRIRPGDTGVVTPQHSEGANIPGSEFDTATRYDYSRCNEVGTISHKSVISHRERCGADVVAQLKTSYTATTLQVLSYQECWHLILQTLGSF